MVEKDLFHTFEPAETVCRGWPPYRDSLSSFLSSSANLFRQNLLHVVCFPHFLNT
jgi:hypothetical protein